MSAYLDVPSNVTCFCRELHKNESSRIMGENVELIKEINDLRRENRSHKATQGRDEPGRGNSQELLRELVRSFWQLLFLLLTSVASLGDAARGNKAAAGPY